MARRRRVAKVKVTDQSDKLAVEFEMAKTIQDLTPYERAMLAAITSVGEAHALTGVEMVIGLQRVLGYMDFTVRKKHQEIWDAM